MTSLSTVIVVTVPSFEAFTIGVCPSGPRGPVSPSLIVAVAFPSTEIVVTVPVFVATTLGEWPSFPAGPVSPRGPVAPSTPS